MPSFYILNSAVITAPGTYKYYLVTINYGRVWLNEHNWKSAIGYQETADALEEATGMNGKYSPIKIPVNRQIIKMEEGDEALVFRLVFPSGYRPDPAQKGKLGYDFIHDNCEIGILRRI